MNSRTLIGTAAVGAGVAAAVMARRRAVDRSTVRHRSTVRAVTVNRPPAEVYDFWRELPRLAEAMARRTRVEQVDERYSRWSMDGPVGRRARWHARITEDRPGRALAWQVDDGPAPHYGRVWFTDASLDRGTEVRVALRYASPGGRVGRLLLSLTGDEPDLLLRTTLRRVKSLLECGQVVVAGELTSGRGPAAERVTRMVRDQLTTGGRP